MENLFRDLFVFLLSFWDLFRDLSGFLFWHEGPKPIAVWIGKYEKITDKNTKKTIFVFFRYFFSYFRGPTLGGGFCNFFVIFSYFRPWGVFVPCTSPTESQSSSLLLVFILPARLQKLIGACLFFYICAWKSCVAIAVAIYSRAGKKPINKETHKQNFHGIVPGLSRDCPGLFLRFPGNFVYVFLFFPRKKGNT